MNDQILEVDVYGLEHPYEEQETIVDRSVAVKTAIFDLYKTTSEFICHGFDDLFETEKVDFMRFHAKVINLVDQFDSVNRPF